MLNAHIQTRRARLHPVPPVAGQPLRDLLTEYGLETHPDMETFVAAHGGSPAGTEAQFLVEQTVDGRHLGLASLRHVDAQTREGEIEMLVREDDLVNGLGIEANILLINYLFAEWDLSLIRFWPAAEYSSDIASYPSMLTEASDLTPEQQERAAGRRTFVIRREDWERIGVVFLRVLVRA